MADQTFVSTNKALDIVREDGVKDLPMRPRMAFAKALKAERDNGSTNEEALAFLQQAIDLVQTPPAA